MLAKIKRTFAFILSHELAKKNRVKAIQEFVVWQIQTALAPNKYHEKTFASKLKVLVNRGQTGMTGNIYTGLHEFEDMAFLLHFLRPEDTFVDAGANVGSYTLLASGLASAKTYSFEPVPSTYERLNANIKLNNLENSVNSYNMGLSARKGTLMFRADSDTTNHVVKEKQSNTINVQVNTLDQILAKNYPSLIKIDVEGYESEVLNGGQSTLNNSTLKAIIIELNGSGERYGYNDNDIHNKLTTLGFKPADYHPFKRMLSVKNTFGTTNTIYVRDFDFVNQRIQSSKLYKVLDVEF